MQQIDETDSIFQLKRAVERLREGLFDLVAVRLLTAHETQLQDALNKILSKSLPDHLMICGDYGQGKSHSLAYIRDKALQQGFAVSRVNLDIRELPMHNFRQIYMALVNDIFFPEQGNSSNESNDVTDNVTNDVTNNATSNVTALSVIWRNWAKQQNFESAQDVLDFLPAEMPHLFRCVLTAMTQKNMPLTQKQKTLKKHAQFRPKDYSSLLNLALAGEAIPLVKLRSALKYRQVPGYTQASLSNKGNQPYVTMLQSLATLIQQMGYKGWVLLFDEAESISQIRVTARSPSYHLLKQLIFPSNTADKHVIPVFALTDDFFARLREEDYDKTRFRNEIESPYFLENYAHSLNPLNTFRLHDLSQQEWTLLIKKLISLYCQAYLWEVDQDKLYDLLLDYIANIKNKETRLKIKALINECDLAYQDFLWGTS